MGHPIDNPDVDWSVVNRGSLMPLYTREQYEADMETLRAIKTKALKRYVKSEQLQQDMRACHLDGHHNTGDSKKCPFCVHAEQALQRVYYDPFKYMKVARQCEELEEAFTKRLRATARFLTELDSSKFIAKSCKALKHKCYNPKGCGCPCHGRKRT
jgi:hypothetical protein